MIDYLWYVLVLNNYLWCNYSLVLNFILKKFICLFFHNFFLGNYTKHTCGLAWNHFAYPWFKKCHFTHLRYVSFVFRNPLLLKSRVNRYFCSNFMSFSSQNKKLHKNARETRSKSGIYVSLHSHKFWTWRTYPKE